MKLHELLEKHRTGFKYRRPVFFRGLFVKIGACGNPECGICVGFYMPQDGEEVQVVCNFAISDLIADDWEVFDEAN